MKKLVKTPAQWIKRITHQRRHCAFTDLQHFNGKLYCCYRQATDHVSGDGIIIVQCLSEVGSSLYQQRIAVEGADLRDPKLTLTPDGGLLLLAYARYRNSSNKTLSTRNLTWHTSTGETWSSPTNLNINLWWLWRVRYVNQHANTAYGLAYRKAADRLDLYAGDPRRKMSLVRAGVLSKEQHSLGYPNESDIDFANDMTLRAIVRRDADSFSAQYGEAKPPYTRWQWFDLGEYIGGPIWQRLSPSVYLVAGRCWTGKTLYTRLWLFNSENRQLEVFDTLPSAGDNSYPGISITTEYLYVSYYSSHIDDHSEIYLACYAIDDVLKEIEQ
ncbi:hypothetical protein QTP81_06105 [Alteromonas sp. ASW11-36]|uniref:Exo-alpha-sialidase n=1 Tax=Alteromonas arenosi TaxID=3055817 RepID=A0ABT7SVG0_9ALTE|nr:hypothetical protein [Alteromonas sp. ASW11-36]MDM7860163.1 hypothetical protein [Alteromonas sp. ASW11-36]